MANMANGKSLMQRLVDAGLTSKQMDHHYSDLYVPKTAVTKRVIEEWCAENGYRFDHFVKPFKSNFDGSPWYDVAFQYDPAFQETI